MHICQSTNIFVLSNATLFLDIDPLKNRNAKDHIEDKGKMLVLKLLRG